jgi:hypothetical protein
MDGMVMNTIEDKLGLPVPPAQNYTQHCVVAEILAQRKSILGH